MSRLITLAQLFRVAAISLTGVALLFIGAAHPENLAQARASGSIAIKSTEVLGAPGQESKSTFIIAQRCEDSTECPNACDFCNKRHMCTPASTGNCPQVRALPGTTCVDSDDCPGCADCFSGVCENVHC
jgi:hypothetical protein